MQPDYFNEPPLRRSDPSRGNRLNRQIQILGDKPQSLSLVDGELYRAEFCHQKMVSRLSDLTNDSEAKQLRPSQRYSNSCVKTSNMLKTKKAKKLVFDMIQIKPL
jgi:hypothetical protein